MKLVSNIAHQARKLRVHTRFRHFRGHGVHSPFVYSLVRDVFMTRGFISDGEHTLFYELRKIGSGKHSAKQLQNLFEYCGYNDFVVWIEKTSQPVDSCEPGTNDLVIIPYDKNNSLLRSFLNWPERCKRTVVVLDPRKDLQRAKLCNMMVTEKLSTSIDNRRYMVFFNDRNMPYQHYKL